MRNGAASAGPRDFTDFAVLPGSEVSTCLYTFTVFFICVIHQGCGLVPGATCKVSGRLFVDLCLAPLPHFLFPAGDISSISGSDSESSDASSESESPPPASNNSATSQHPRSHKVLLRNAKGQLISAYRCILSTGKASHSPACWKRGPREEGWHWGADICLGPLEGKGKVWCLRFAAVEMLPAV